MKPNPFWICAAQTNTSALISIIQKPFISVTYCLIVLQFVHRLLFLFPFPTKKDRCSPEGFQTEKRGCPVPKDCAVAMGTPSPPSASASVQARPVSSSTHRSLGHGRQSDRIWGMARSPGKRPPPLFPAPASPYCNSSGFSNFPPHLHPSWKLRANAKERENKGAKNKEPGRGREGREGERSPLSGQPGGSPAAAPGGSPARPPQSRSRLLPRRLPQRGTPAGRPGPPLGWPWVPYPGYEPPSPARASSGSGLCPTAKRPLLPCPQEQH